MKVLSKFQYDAGMFASNPIPVVIEVGHYSNNRLWIKLFSEMEEVPGEYEPFATATTNLVDEDCPEEEIWIKDWSENEGMTDWLISNKIIESGPTCNATTDYAQAQRYKLTKEFLSVIADALVRNGVRSRR